MAKSSDKSPRTVSVNIGLDVTDDTPIFYANHFEVGHSNNEFMLNIARFPPKPSSEQMKRAAETGALIIEPEMQVLFPPRIALALLEALKVQIASYEKNIGEIKP